MAEASLPLDRAGALIAGRYLIEEALGRGGMATVYRVLDQTTGTRCALKRAWAQSPHLAKRRQQLLEREYHTLAQLAHPRIIQVYDFGVDADGPYYTMELLDGEDLASLGRVPWQQACALLRDVASSLAVLHSRGLLHRDVSARNVRCGGNGEAKLIDFGALCSVGVDLEVVGTPPFIAPEALQMQALDSRADLFSLGALGYYLLTGRHAYPARLLRELRDVWRSPPPAPLRLVPELPPALNQLILELLTLDRNARPQLAADVMRRVCTIAHLPIDEDIAVSRAYLTAPALVGRDQALMTARKTLLSLPRGDGQTLFIEGAPGSGRSRMLDASVLEGKLLGALVLRAHAVGSEGTDWAVVRSLIAQLLPFVPEKIDEASRLSRDVLAHVVDDLRSDAPPGPFPERSLLIRELRDFILALSAGQRMLIVVDDCDRIDEPSLAVLSAVAHKTQRHPLVLVLAAERRETAPASASLRLLHSVATRIELTPFTDNQTEALLRSVFGDVPNLKFVAAHVHRIAQGNAAVTMALAEHLVQRELCRYEAGSWQLPAALSEGDLPSSLAASLEARLLALSADARALCEAASVSLAPALPLSRFAELSEGWTPERVFAALHELVSTRVMVLESEYYHFSQHGYASVARAQMSESRRHTLHGRLADVLQAQGGDPLTIAHHMLEAQRDRAAIDLLQGLDSDRRHPPLPLLQRALGLAEQRGMATRVIEDLRISVMSASTLALDVETFQKVSPLVLQRLVSDSGLARYQELAELEPGERLKQALVQTHERHLATPERERGYPVDEAIRKLARLSNTYGVICLFSGDLALIQSFPDIEPLQPLSAAIGVMRELLAGATYWHTGRFGRAAQCYERTLARIAQPDRGGLDPGQLPMVRSVCLVLLGMLEASWGIARCEQRAQLLEDDRVFRVNTWRIRQVFHLSQGDTERARQCMRRAELLQLQEGLEQQADGGVEGIALIAYMRAEDLLGIRSTLADLAPLAEQLPYWRIAQRFGQSAVLRLQGDPQAALDVLRTAFEYVEPGKHWLFGPVAAAEVHLLGELGRWEEAVELGRRYLEVTLREELVSGYEIQGPLGLALAHTGHGEEGLRMIENWIREQRSSGQSGIIAGTAYEAAARVCLSMGDREGFTRFVDLCALTYKNSHNFVLNAKLARLRAHGDPSAMDAPLSPQLAAEAATIASQYETIYSRIRECVDPQDRARCALTLLLQQAERFSGYLFGLTPAGELQLCYALPEEPERGLCAWVNGWFKHEVSQDVATAQDAAGIATEDAAAIDPPPAAATSDLASGVASVRYRDGDGRNYEPLLMTARVDGDVLAVGALVLEINRGARSLPSSELLEQVGQLMLRHGDVTGTGLLGVANLETRTT